MPQSGFHRGEQQTQIELDQIDVGNGKHYFAPQYNTLVENVAENFRELDSRATK
jgi:hypothetical protein